MPTLRLFAGYNFEDAFSGIGETLGEGNLTNATSTNFTVTAGNARVSVNGTGFTYFGVIPVGGTIESITGTIGSRSVATFTGLELPVAILTTAIANEGSNPASLENLFFGMNWRINGTNGAETLLPGMTTSDGVPVNLRGNDVFDLRGGRDRVFAGDGNDTVNGGSGDDELWGGNGNDRLIGGSGADTLDGGKGIDKLIGGADGDIFVFHRGDGRDAILDFQDGVDRLDFGRLQVRVEAYGDPESGPFGTMLYYNGGSVKLVGVDASLIDATDFL